MYTIDIKTREKVTDISPSLYGLFFEDINRAGDGGLYAEMLRNRAFEDGVIPEGCTYDAANQCVVSPTGWHSSFNCCESEGIAGWEARNGAEMKLTDKDTLNRNRKRALCVKFNGGMICNDGFMGVSVESEKQYPFYMFAKSDEPVTVNVTLISECGEEYARHVFKISGGYAKYECLLKSSSTDHNARLALSSDSSACITFGFVSLFPKDTFMGRENGLRKPLAERLIKLNPAFLRFPGGCIVEGFSTETAFRFKHTIGPVWERKSHWLLWSYMTTNGLGFHEYLQFCEDAGIDAIYVFNCGMTCQGRNPDYFNEQLIVELYDDTVQAILYATAPENTEWGKKRAENGHPEPFNVLKYLEIGNENWGSEYNKRYKYFYEKLKKQFPQFTYISTDHTEKAGLATEFVDEHFYSDSVFFASNTKLYDDLNRTGAKIYCGEYAATIGCKEGNLYGALGEAAFLTGIERNQDIVRMTSYAPLFKNVDYVSWEPDLIIFNNHEDYAIPSYYMLQMFANNRGDYICGHNISTDFDRHIESGFFNINGAVKEGDRFSAVCNDDLIHIRFWDKGTQGEDQDHYDWIAENGKSRVVHHNGWSCEVICEEIPCDIRDKENVVEIVTHMDHFTITLNGKIIHDHTLAPIPHIMGVCSVDEASGEVVVKIVNFSEKKAAVKICCDVEMETNAKITTLTADNRYSQNSFKYPKVVYPHTNNIWASSDYIAEIKPNSVNVIRHKIKSE